MLAHSTNMLIPPHLLIKAQNKYTGHLKHFLIPTWNSQIIDTYQQDQPWVDMQILQYTQLMGEL